MPRNPSKARQSASQSSNTNVSQELRSLNSTTDWLCHLVDNLDKKVDTLAPGLPQSGDESTLGWLCQLVDNLDKKVDMLTSPLPATGRAPQFARQPTFPRTGNQPGRISDPLPTALLEAEYSPPLPPAPPQN